MSFPLTFLVVTTSLRGQRQTRPHLGHLARSLWLLFQSQVHPIHCPLARQVAYNGQQLGQAVGERSHFGSYRKFHPEKRQWIKEHYEKYPLSFIDEAAVEFEENFGLTISGSHIWTILAEAGFTRKVLLVTSLLSKPFCPFLLL